METDLNDKCFLPDDFKLDVNQADIITLEDLKDGEAGILVRIDGGLGALTRLCHLGLTPGTRIRKMQSAPFKGPIKLQVRDTYLALGRGIARKIILVKETEAM